MNLALFRCVWDFERLQGTAGIQGVALRIDQIALQATDHHLTQAFLVGEDVAREALVVKQFQQRCERLGIAVVRRRGQEQPVLEVRADGADEAGALAFQRVVSACGGRDVVRLIHDQQVELARVADVRRDHVAHGAQAFAAFGPIHRRDEARMRRPRVGVNAALAPQLLDVVGVDHAEVEAELLEHLDAPLLLERRGADDQDGARAMPQQQLLNDQTGFDGFAEADVIGDEQIDASHVDGAHQGIELEVLDADAATERSLEKSPIGIGSSTPSHGIEERVERVRVVLPRDRRQASPLDDLSARLDLPDDLKFFAETVLVDRRQRQAVLRCTGIESGCIDVGHHPLTAAHFDELSWLGASAICLRLPFVLDAHVMTIFPISSS